MIPITQYPEKFHKNQSSNLGEAQPQTLWVFHMYKSEYYNFLWFWITSIQQFSL